MSLKEMLSKYRVDVEDNLKNNILNYWIDYTVDRENGGFYGLISNTNDIDRTSTKGCILNSRILWTFSSAYMMYKEPKYLEIANHAYDFMMKYLWDKDYSGLYWMVEYDGKLTDGRKQIYNLAFGIYGLTEYYRATGNKESLEKAIELYKLIELHSYDPDNKGYIEALAQDWKPIEDMRLSDKDLNSAKSMNTHLHILEGYTNLLRVWKDSGLVEKMRELIQVTINHIIDGETSHFKLFFDRQWNTLSHEVSYGHDIEGSWLLYEAAEVLDDTQVLARVRDISLNMAQKVYEEGYDYEYYGIYNEGKGNQVVDNEKPWWPQAEAMVGFLNAYELDKKEHYLKASYDTWGFVEKYVVDKKNGEWFWKVSREGKPDLESPKVEPWKCPYHNSRACYEVIKRIDNILY